MGSMILAVVAASGCSHISVENSARQNANNADNGVAVKVPVPRFKTVTDVSHNGSEEYSEALHKETGPLHAVAYSPSLGFLAEKQALEVPQKAKVKVGYGSIVQLDSNKELPQPSPILGYEPDYIEASKDYICYVYQSSGIGPNVGELVYAYNIKTGISTKLWSPATGTNEQLMEFQLEGDTLYFGVQSSTGDTVKVEIHQVDLNTMKQKVILISMGSKTDKVVEDFAVSGNLIGLIWTPASHFLPDGGFNASEPYDFTIGPVGGSSKEYIYSGTNANSFDMRASNGLWTWSDKTNGVECYSKSSNQLWNVAKYPSYVATDGVCVWWKAVDTPACGGFDTSTQKNLKLSHINSSFTPIVSNGRIILSMNENSYFWTTAKHD